MNRDTQQLIDVLKAREEGMSKLIHKAATRGNEQDRIHYIGWLRGIEGSRRLVQYLFRDKE